MKARDLRAKSAAELQEELLRLRKDEFNLRMQAASGQAPRSDQFGKVRKDIARVKTVLSEMKKTAPKAISEGEKKQ